MDASGSRPHYAHFSLRMTLCLLATCVLLSCSGGGDGDSGASGSAAPAAEAKGDPTVPVGTAVTLDGTASQAPSGAAVSYQWTLTEKPPGSTASLANPTSARPTFTPDVAGRYTASLVVTASGVASQPDVVSIDCVTGNVAPHADAGPDRSAVPGRAITLDGSASRDPNNTPVTYSWRIVTQPTGSNPVLTNTTTATPVFTTDITGLYIVALTVSDGSLTSAPDQMQITVANSNLPPVANAGPDQTVTAGQLVTLNGSGSSDPNGDPLTYSWCLRGKPDGSRATLTGANTAQPTFTADVAGSYVLCLTVNDGQASSASDTVVVEARLPSSGGGVLQAYVKPSNMTFPQLRSFGQSVDLDGDTLVVGANDPSCATGINGNQTNRDCPSAGAVYVFIRTGETWSQQAYLKASNTGAGDNFGTSVSLRGDMLAVGAPSESSCATGVNGNQADNGCMNAGAVYVFTRQGNTWSQQAYIKASTHDPIYFDLFGQAVALSGNTLAVGAPYEGSCATGINGDQADNTCNGSGAAYVFTHSENIWTQEAYVKASNNHLGAVGFGRNVALDGDTLAVSWPLEGSCSTGINGDQFSNSCGSAGAVYVFTRTAGVWGQQAYVKASNTHSSGGQFGGDQFGAGLVLIGDALLVGAPGEASCATGIDGNQADKGCPGAGAVYEFRRMNNVWSQVAYLKAIPVGFQNVNGGIGRSLAFDGTTLATGSVDHVCGTGFNPSPSSNDCHASGAAYLFTRTANGWAQRAYVKASNPGGWDFFGGALAVAGNTLAVGAISEDSCATGINGNQNDNSCGPDPTPDSSNRALVGSGAAYVYLMQ
jgi:hypothetical protein